MNDIKSQLSSAIAYEVENLLIDQNIDDINSQDRTALDSKKKLLDSQTVQSLQVDDFQYLFNDRLKDTGLQNLINDQELSVLDGYYDPLTGGSGVAIKSREDLFIAYSGSNSNDVKPILERNNESIIKFFYRTQSPNYPLSKRHFI